MNITEALGDIAASFPRAERSIETGEPGSSAHDVSSGGVKARSPDAEPALYLTAESAIAAWRDQMLALLKAEKATGFSVIDGPHLDKWRVTVADGGYTHRIAEDRYSVTARVGIVRAVVADPGEAGTAMAKNIHGDVPIVKPTMAAELPKPKSAKAAKTKVA
jgi:hypothetical protein